MFVFGKLILTLGSVVSLAMFYLFSYQIIFLSKKSCPPQSWPLVGQVSKGWRGVGGARGQEHHHHRSQLQHQHLERTTTLSLESTTTSASSVIFSYWNIPKQLLIVVILPMVNYARALILVKNFKTIHMQCTMGLSPLKSCIKEFWLNAFLDPHFPSV